MSSSGGDGGRSHSSRLENGKVVVYASSPDTDDEYESMEGPAKRASRQVAKELQRHYDARGEDMSSTLGITIKEPVQPSTTAFALAGSAEVPAGGVASRRAPAPKRRRASARISLTPEDDLEHVVPGRRYPPEGGIWPKEAVGSILLETPLLKDLAQHPSTAVLRCEGLGFRHFLSIPSMSLNHRIVRAWYKLYFHHIGTFHLSTCEMVVLPLDWGAILGICFGGRIPPYEYISREEVGELRPSLTKFNQGLIEALTGPKTRFGLPLPNHWIEYIESFDSVLYESKMDEKGGRATFARRFFPTRSDLVRKLKALRKRVTSATTCNSRIVKSFFGQVGIAIGK
uniref:Aminotransferase-like plant mobile domain-containing protein n=1 Tax=Fagus sylvatica TaxID=28930 RepID=A0A2N9GP20_FAGSY